MNLGLVYSALIENNSQAIEELDDVFEENGLERCKDKYELYWSLFHSEYNYFVSANFNLDKKTFKSIGERESYSNALLDYQNKLDEFFENRYIFYIVAFSKEEYLQEIQNVFNSPSAREFVVNYMEQNNL